jgi:hypothetical protein
MPQMLSVSVGLWVGLGSRYEPVPLNGVCHFIEHLLFKGTKKRSAKEISEAVEGIGGYLRENHVAGNVLIMAVGRLTHRQVLHAVARDFLGPERLNLALVSPLASDRSVARLLSDNTESSGHTP